MIKNIGSFLNSIYEDIKKFTDIAVIHLTGDLNSTVMSIILAKSLGKENVYALDMTYGDDLIDLELFSDPSLIAKEIDINFIKSDTKFISDEINTSLSDIFSNLEILKKFEVSSTNLQNSRSRSRMAILYGLRHQISQVTNKKTRVIGSYGLCEDFINYFPEGGESLVDLLPLAELFKSEINQIAQYYISKKIIKSDLIKNKKHITFFENEFGLQDVMFTYDELEESVRKIASDNWSSSEWSPIDEFVWKRHFQNKNENQIIRILSLREKFCDAEGFKSNRNSNRRIR